MPSSRGWWWPWDGSAQLRVSGLRGPIFSREAIHYDFDEWRSEGGRRVMGRQDSITTWTVETLSGLSQQTNALYMDKVLALHTGDGIADLALVKYYAYDFTQSVGR
jgi:hypothetical protein